jgi:hypothetical protein
LTDVLPATPQRCAGLSRHNVIVDSRGLIYLVDRLRGVGIIETNVF